MQSEVITPRIYVTCVTAQEAGIAHGVWIDASQERETVCALVDAMIAASPVEGAESVRIAEHEGFGSLTVDEHTCPEEAAIMADFVKRHGGFGIAVATYFDSDVDRAEGAIHDQYIGRYPSLAAYLEQHPSEAVGLPDASDESVDWQELAENNVFEGEFDEVVAEDGSAYIFRGWASSY